MANRVDPLYLRITEPRITDGGAGALPSVRDIYKDLSLTSQFKVSLHLQRSGADDLDGHLTGCGIFDDFASTNYTYDFFAAEANIPGANFDLAEQSAAYQGMLEYMPYRRIFAPFDVTYYVDDNYNILRLFEEWMNYINPLYGDRGRYGGGWTGQTDFNESNAYYRMRYPSKYKRPITITKFEREFWKNPNEPRDGETNMPLISYQLIDAFPQQVTAVPLSYSGSEITKVSVTFGYTRYVTIKDNGAKSSSHARRNNADRYPEEAMNLTPHYGTYYGYNDVDFQGSSPVVSREVKNQLTPEQQRKQGQVESSVIQQKERINLDNATTNRRIRDTLVGGADVTPTVNVPRGTSRRQGSQGGVPLPGV